MTNPIEKLREYGYELPAAKPPVASYVPVVRTGNLLFVSGQISSNEQGVVAGLLGDNMNVVQGGNAAELAVLNVLAHVVHSAGIPPSEATRIVKLPGLVAPPAESSVTHPRPLGPTPPLVGILGDKGKHARAAFGVAALPFGAAVEIEAVFEV